MKNVKLLEAIGKFLDSDHVTHYTIDGYYGFAYLDIEEFNTDTMKIEVRRWKFNIVDDAVEIEDKGIQLTKD
jgi:hypothetical protein